MDRVCFPRTGHSDPFIYPFFLVLLQLENFPLWNISSLRMANGDLFV